MAKAISLTVHRNTKAKRDAADLANGATRAIRAMIREKGIVAFAFVGVGSDGQRYTLWNTGAQFPLHCLPGLAFQTLSDDIATSGIEDDWKPALWAKGSK